MHSYVLQICNHFSVVYIVYFLGLLHILSFKSVFVILLTVPKLQASTCQYRFTEDLMRLLLID